MTTENMKPYPAYKDSGIEWIGEIPEGWDIRKLKWVVKGQLKYGANEVAELDDKEYPRYIRITDFGNDGKLKQDSFKSLPFDKARDYLLNEGDVLFARSGATVGKTFQFKNYNGLACFAGYLIKASPQTDVLSSDFLYYFTKSNTYENWKNSIFVQATIQNIGADKYNLLQVPIPNFDEQKSITKFLNNQTAKIDILIENKQKQIELLKEERTAIINQAVIKGLNPNVPMRDSGIEWLGKIPGHWRITKLKFILNKIGSGLTPRGGAEVYQDYGVPLLRSQNVHFDGLRLDDVAYVSNETHKSMNRSAVKPNDVLINITGASIGRCAIIPNDFSDGNVNQHVCILRTSEKILSKYLHLLLSSQIGQLQVFNSQNGAAREGLNFEQLGDFFVTLPLLDEQNELTKSISAYIDESMVLISKIQQQITLLQEYRTALISEAVTGKIDLRHENGKELI